MQRLVYARRMWWRASSSPQVEAALAQTRLFESLSRRDLRRLSSLCVPKSYPAGESILEEGTTGLGLFLLTAGKVEVTKELDGRQIRLAVLTVGDVLGEMALLDDQPRSASARTLEPTDCLLLSRDRFRMLLRRRPRLAWPVVPALAHRIRDLQEQLLEAESTGSSEPAERPAPQETESSPESPVVVAREPATEQETPQHATATSGSAASSTPPSLWRAQYALMMAGAASMAEPASVVEVFLTSLDESTGLSEERSWDEMLSALPAGLWTASQRSWSHGLGAPGRVFERFRSVLDDDSNNTSRDATLS